MSADGRGTRRAAVASGVAALAFLGFVALGVWQIERRAWKLELIARVEQRVHAAPTAAPGAQRWPQLSAAADEYRHVAVTGRFLHDRETLVRATTALGGGWWVLTPLMTADGTVVIVNRGFVPPERRSRQSRFHGEPQGELTVTGLLRVSEPGGTWLERNDAAAGRWVSRDVAAIAAARGLSRVAPYFIDADAPPAGPGGAGRPAEPDLGQPVAGLTVIAFRNNHLVYAITWFALALLVAVATGHAMLDARRRRARRSGLARRDVDDSPPPRPGGEAGNAGQPR